MILKPTIDDFRAEGDAEGSGLGSMTKTEEAQPSGGFSVD